MTDLIALDDSSRVWIYQADSFFTEEQIPELSAKIREFITHWVSHRNQLRAYGNIFHQRFVCFFVDESQAPASGCSIDSSVAFLQDLAKEYGKNMIEREHFGYIVDDVVKFVHMNELSDLKKSGKVTDETLFFDNLVKTKDDFIHSWLKPLGESWQMKFVE